jgi:hypothetical protein
MIYVSSVDGYSRGASPSIAWEFDGLQGVLDRGRSNSGIFESHYAFYEIL